MFNRWVTAGLLLLVFISSAGAAEYRAMWISRYEWPDADPDACRAIIDQDMASLESANFNAVFFQIRGQADTFYPSPYETWSPLIGETDPGWDPLAYAIQSAHDHGIEFHAYINTHTCWQHPSDDYPSDPNHTFYCHCNLADPLGHDWLHHLSELGTVQYSESDYVWFAPGIPEYQSYIRQQVLYVVENYDVDGVHFDRIRTPWSGQPSYDSVSLTRFQSMQSNPDNLSFTEWTADQITRTVRDIYAEIQSVKPDVVVSAAVYSNPNYAPTSVHQAALDWANTGCMDLLVPMMYYTGGEDSSWDTRLQTWISGTGRHVIAGHITTQGLSSLLEQVLLTRMRGGEGNNIFSINSFNGWDDYLAQVYQTPDTIPVMDWKVNPQDAVIYGYVLDAIGNPVVDAQINSEGSSYTALSSADGFYSILQVTPGSNIDLSVTHPGYTSGATATVTVSAGDVRRRDFLVGSPLPPVLAEVSPDPDLVIVENLYVRQMQLLQGIATLWELLDGPNGAVITQSGYIKNWIPSEVGTYTFSARATNSSGSSTETWQVQVLEEDPCERFTVIDFEGYSPGSSAMFRVPRYSGSSINHLRYTPNVAEVTDVTGYDSNQSLLVQWQYVDEEPERWMRLTTYHGAGVPNPTIPLDRPIRVRLRVDEGRFRIALGVRETGTNIDIGEDGGTAGTIEWVGADSDSDGAPQGYVIEAIPGEWQTIIFDPLTCPITTMNGDGVLSTPTGKGTLEHLAFSCIDEAGPFTVYIDDIEILCEQPEYGDFNNDWDVCLRDYTIFESCLSGPGVTLSPACLVIDSDGDSDGDLADFAAFQAAFGTE